MREANPLQQTGAWFNERTGKLTASRMASAMAFLKEKIDKKTGKPPIDEKTGKPVPREEKEERRKLKNEILCERLTGDIVPKYLTQDMQHGIDQEPFAKQAAELKMGWKIKDLPFIPHPFIENCGASPDGLIESENALVEIKCPSKMTMLSWILSAAEDPNWLPEEHIPQMTLQSACMGGIPVYFVAFDPRLPEKQKLLIRKFTPTEEEIAKVEEAAKQFLKEVDAMFDKLTIGE